MGASNLRQLSLSLSSEFSQIPIGPNSTRIAIITYSDTATVVADLRELNSSADVSKALLSLKVSNSSSAAGINDAMLFAHGVADACYGDTQCNIDHSLVYVVIGASLK
uniref:VWFA domain-containing protein n=1 Tax=Acrobeloides nanus TaxID=290746 RepID=A0A914EI52_9BILA